MKVMLRSTELNDKQLHVNPPPQRSRSKQSVSVVLLMSIRLIGAAQWIMSDYFALGKILLESLLQS